MVNNNWWLFNFVLWHQLGNRMAFIIAYSKGSFKFTFLVEGGAGGFAIIHRYPCPQRRITNQAIIRIPSKAEI
jgi:hypothetical protein